MKAGSACLRSPISVEALVSGTRGWGFESLRRHVVASAPMVPVCFSDAPAFMFRTVVMVQENKNACENRQVAAEA